MTGGAASDYEIFQQGCTAFVDGKKLSACPYAKGTGEAVLWAAGHKAEREEIRAIEEHFSTARRQKWAD